MVAEKVCEICGKRYVPKFANQRFTCSKECSKRHEAIKNRERVKHWSLEQKEVKKQRRKEDYQKNRERYIQQAKKWYSDNPERLKYLISRRINQGLHGGLKDVVYEQCKGKCQKCGKKISGKAACIHHTTFDPQRHEFQLLLCRSCHKTLHLREEQWKEKQISKEYLLSVLNSSKSYADAARKLGMSKTTVYHKRKEFGLAINPAFGRIKGNYKKDTCPARVIPKSLGGAETG